MNIFLINGPPRSGKDLSGRMLGQMLPGKTRLLKFAHVLKLITHSVCTIMGGLEKVQPPEHYDALKEDPNADFFGAKPRDAYIAMSEDFCKPVFGKRIFGRVLLKQVEKLREDGVDNVVVTDCGFAEEIQVFVAGLPDDTIHLIRMSREGCDYSNDSRSDINPADVGLPGVSIIENPGTLGGLRVAVAKYLQTLEENS